MNKAPKIFLDNLNKFIFSAFTTRKYITSLQSVNFESGLTAVCYSYATRGKDL